MGLAKLELGCGEQSLTVQRFSVEEQVSSLFVVTVRATSPSPSLDLGAIIGAPASLHIASGYAFAHDGGRQSYAGLCSHAALLHAEPRGLSRYELHLVPALWRASLGRDYRVFQHATTRRPPAHHRGLELRAHPAAPPSPHATARRGSPGRKAIPTLPTRPAACSSRRSTPPENACKFSRLQETPLDVLSSRACATARSSAAVRAGAVDEVVALDRIATRLRALVG